MPGPSRALARAADPPVAAHRGGMLAPAAGAAAAPVAIARAALTALRVLARAGLVLRKVRAHGGLGAPPRSAKEACLQCKRETQAAMSTELC